MACPSRHKSLVAMQNDVDNSTQLQLYQHHLGPIGTVNDVFRDVVPGISVGAVFKYLCSHDSGAYRSCNAPQT